MCGVSAVVRLDRLPRTQKIIEDMVNIQSHRGPDGHDTWISEDGRVSLGHNRLAIIEPTSDGAQPWVQSESALVLVWNGEIYNHKEIRQELISLGYDFKTRTDSEVILSAYQAWGSNSFNKFKGMWAILIYDQTAQKLIISRDRFGIKPLYFAFTENHLILASELKTIRLLSPKLNVPDLQMLEKFYSDGSVIHTSKTFFKNISKFPPANYAEFLVSTPEKKLNLEQYWNIPETYLQTMNQDINNSILTSLKKSVREHTISDVPISCALSGGLDSSAITALAEAVLEEQNQRLSSFTVEWPNDREINESDWAKILTEKLNIESFKVKFSDEEMMQFLNEIIYFQDEPIASSSIVSQFFLYREASQKGFKVVLDGQGADEIFLGYQALIPMFLLEKWIRGHVKSVFQDLLMLIIRNQKYRGGTLKIALNAVWKIIFSLGSQKRHTISCQTLLKLQRELIFGGNLESLLRYQDRNSMRWGVESRVPFLDHELVEKIMGFDPYNNWDQGYTKLLLRDALQGVLPENLRKRRDKLGYSTPEKRWLDQLGVQIEGNPENHASWRRFIGERWLAQIINSETFDHAL